jgi:hypothetical protein
MSFLVGQERASLGRFLGSLIEASLQRFPPFARLTLPSWQQLSIGIVAIADG